ncbi:hypothetical protein GO730_32845 [Spirosoma sp. HMF3257]|uniref:Uncharacterized protein n=1 Tax=Spirosoma telluris TaxID=2183553 RepID=A0A327NXU9_9BACT|nr:hypothetical protein [Spirosoma telluris]RAI77718.1 hypothetical protein HMF3257_32750 [Spirosoma telluris]
MANNAVGRSVLGRTAGVQAEIRSRQVAVPRPEFILVDATTGKPVDQIKAQKSMSAAYYEQWKAQKANPLQKLTVIPGFDRN